METLKIIFEYFALTALFAMAIFLVVTIGSASKEDDKYWKELAAKRAKKSKRSSGRLSKV